MDFLDTVGLIAGFLAKLIVPGRDSGGVIVTMVIGIVGGVIGGFIGKELGLGPFSGINPQFSAARGGAATL